jgi:hypothetical protein
VLAHVGIDKLCMREFPGSFFWFHGSVLGGLGWFWGGVGREGGRGAVLG